MADSSPPEVETGTKPGPDVGSPPPVKPTTPTVTASAVTLESPSPLAVVTTSSPAQEPVVPEPRLHETVRVEIVPAPKTNEERAWGLGYFTLVTLVFGLAAAAALSWNWRYIDRFLALPSAIGSWAPPPFPFPAWPAAILATIQIVVLGGVAYRFLFPRHTEPWEAIAFVLGLGEGLTGLTGTILALTGHFTFGWIEVVILGFAAAPEAEISHETRRSAQSA